MRRRPASMALLAVIVTACGAATSPTTSGVVDPTTTQPLAPTTTASQPSARDPLPGFIPVADPVVIGVRASTSAGDSVNVLDEKDATAWTTDDAAPQWIEFQLREPLHIKSIKVVIGLDASGIGDHEFRAGAHDNPGRMAAALEVEAGIGSGFEVFVEYEAEFVRITTTRSTGTISWAEIEIIVEG